MAWIIDPEEILDEINWRVGSNIAEPPASKTTDWGVSNDRAWITSKPDVIPGEKFALPVTWVRGIKLRLFAFSSVAASHDRFATGLRSGRPIFVLPLLRENKTPGCPIQRVLENDFVVVTAQAPRVILSGFSLSNCIEKTKRKPVCQVCQLRAS